MGPAQMVTQQLEVFFLRALPISVVVPVFNEQDRLLECLLALKQQRSSVGIWELIIVDNGSTDQSREIAETFAAQGCWRSNDQLVSVRVIDEPVRDVYIARNKAIAESQGDLIAFTDSHCRVAPDWLECLTSELNADTGIVVGSLEAEERASLAARLYTLYHNERSQLIFSEEKRPYYYGQCANMIVRHQLFDSLGPFPSLPLAGDTEILHRYMAADSSAKIRYTLKAKVTRLSVLSFKEMLGKLRNYGKYTQALSRSSKFQALSLGTRMRVYLRCARKLSALQSIYLLGVLTVGLIGFNIGRTQWAMKPTWSRTH